MTEFFTWRLGCGDHFFTSVEPAQNLIFELAVAE